MHNKRLVLLLCIAPAGYGIGWVWYRPGMALAGYGINQVWHPGVRNEPFEYSHP